MLDHNAQAAALQEDHAGRRAAVTVFDTPIYLRAGAGTGKTTTLVARILAWTTGQGWERALREDPARALGYSPSSLGGRSGHDLHRGRRGRHGPQGAR